ncbi:MAG TPA: DUF1549 domain-containing protein [Isosphaeraceae bacterium]|jgi:hypothetical protein|nr:DUF1549 domain-containing protein [Isosphaeraceae bacterium]
MKRHQPGRRLRACVVLCGMVATATAARAADSTSKSLHERIDERIESSGNGPAIDLVGDAEYLRRISLDLTGMPPTSDELRAFLADTGADKREKAVDRLLEGPLHARHLATSLDILLMERRPAQHVSAEEWQAYLLAATRSNRPLNQVFREILAADGADPGTRPAARFYLDRGSEPNLITRDVGRIVFGRDLQCAQCHNHPSIDDYKQSDYQGLLAFFATSYELKHKEGGKDRVDYAEKAGADLNFVSVFVKGSKHRTGPRVPGEGELVEPVFPAGEEYAVKPVENVLPRPKFSRRAQLATHATDGSNPAFNANLANRLWALMMGRGLVHPVDLHHPDNPPSHPELLRQLADELVASNFDTRAFLRELALTRTYQRTIDLPFGKGAASGDVAAALAELESRTASTKAAAEAARKGYEAATGGWEAAEAALIPVAAEQDQALAKHADLAKKQAEAGKTAAAAAAQVAARQEAAKALAEAAEKALEASKKLPAEKDLAAAAQKFVDRSKAIPAELAALQKASAEKAAALAKADADLAAAAKAVEVARSKTQPLREACRQKEQAVVDSRRRLAEVEVALERHKKRMMRLEAVAGRNALDRKVATAARVVDSRREAVGKARAVVEEHAALLAKRDQDVKAADQVRLTAEKARDDAQGAVDRQEKRLARVAEAVRATEAARSELPDDADLAQVAETLKSKAAALESAAGPLGSRRDAAASTLKTAVAAVAAASRGLEEARAEASRRDSSLAAARKALADEEARLRAARSELDRADERLAVLFADDFDLAQLKPLTPEQIGWSMLRVTGVYDRTRQAVEAELDKASPLNEQARSDPAQVRARALEVESRTFDKLKGTIAPFVQIYAAGAGQPQGDFFATADQALFASNGGLVNGWVAPAAGNIADRMVREPDPKKAAEDLYLTVLSRPPSADEAAEVGRVLGGPAADKPLAVQELVWGLLTSAEFRFNH